MFNTKLRKILIFIFIVILFSGCVLTKLVTVPMRVGGAVVSFIPAVGETAQEVIDKAAEKLDDLPL